MRREPGARAFPLPALALLLLLSCCSSGKDPARGAVVAEVGSERITVDDVRRDVALRRGLPAVLATGGASRIEVEEALRRLVEEAFVVSEGRRRGLSVTDKELEEEVSRHRADFPPGGLEKALVQAGIDMASWREGLRRSLLHRKSAEAIAVSLLSRPPVPAPEGKDGKKGGAEGEATGSRRDEGAEGAEQGADGGADVPPEALPADERRVRVREIIFATRTEAASARELLAAGRSPEGAASLAARNVRPVSVDLGWFAVSALPPGVPKAMVRLPRGGVTDVVSFSGGHTVFVVEDDRAPGVPLLADPKASPGDRAARSRKEEALRLWLEEVRGKTTVRIDEELLSTLYPGRR